MGGDIANASEVELDAAGAIGNPGSNASVEINDIEIDINRSTDGELAQKARGTVKEFERMLAPYERASPLVLYGAKRGILRAASSCTSPVRTVALPRSAK